MEKIKIIVEFRNGTIDSVFGNVDLHFVIVNHDDVSKGRYPVSEPEEVKAIQGPLYQCYSQEDAPQAEIRESLKRLKF